MSVPGVVAIGGRILVQPHISTPAETWNRLERGDQQLLAGLAWDLVETFGSDDMLRLVNRELFADSERLVYQDGSLQPRAALAVAMLQIVIAVEHLKLPIRARLIAAVLRELWPDAEAA